MNFANKLMFVELIGGRRQCCVPVRMCSPPLALYSSL